MPRTLRIPRRAAIALTPIVFLVVAPLVHGGVPWAISTMAERHGWSGGGPGALNLFGLAVIAGAFAMPIWLLATGLKHAGDMPEHVTLDWSPKTLLTSGPYALSRHPMYVGELALWLGCAIFFGSVPVFVGFVCVAAAANVIAAREERALEATFGDSYRRYRSAVPRWLSLRR